MHKISGWVNYCFNKIPVNNGIALDLACGNGRHSLYLSQLGYKVYATDINAECLKSFSGKNINKLLIDVEDLKNWPLFNFKFDVIIVTNFLNRSLFPVILKSLKKNGYLIYETFSDGHQKVGRPKNPSYILKQKELIYFCSNISLIVYEEVYSNNPDYHSYKQRILAYNV